MTTANTTLRITRGATGALTLILGANLATAQVGVPCTKAVQDFSAPGNCLPASSAPMLGMLYPLGGEFYIDGNTGNVGMGTLNPAESLQIGEYFTNSQDTYIELRTVGGAGNEYKQGLKMRSSNPTFGFDIEHDDFLKGLNVRRYDNDAGVNGDSALYIDRIDGNVGLGTTVATRNLHLMSAGPAILRLEADTDDSVETDHAGIEFSQDNGLETGYVGFNNGNNEFKIQSATNDLDFDTGGVNRMRVTLGGSVGIGTVTPASKLSVATGDQQYGVLHEAAGVQVGSYVGFGGGWIGTRSNHPLNLFTNDGGEQVTLTTAGRLGIGTKVPDQLLTVNGGASKPGGGSWTVFSDLRLKKNVRELDGSLDRLLALRGVAFEYKDPESIHELAGERIGFIAQEVEEVMPDWIDDSGEYKSLTIRGFEALAVEALRELTEEVRGKDAELAELKAEVERLTAESARIDALEAALQELRAGR